MIRIGAVTLLFLLTVKKTFGSCVQLGNEWKTKLQGKPFRDSSAILPRAFHQVRL